MITLGIINGGIGLYLAGASNSLKIAYGVVAGIMWVLWMLFAVLGEFRRLVSGDKKKKKNRRVRRSESSRRKLSEGE